MRGFDIDRRVALLPIERQPMLITGGQPRSCGLPARRRPDATKLLRPGHAGREPLKDEQGKPVTGFDTQRLRAAEHAVESAVPCGSQFAPQAGRADTSTWWDPQYRRYALSHGHGQLPDDLRPSARPVGGFLGLGSRLLGMPLLDLPSGGIVNQISNAKQIGYERKAAARR